MHFEFFSPQKTLPVERLSRAKYETPSDILKIKENLKNISQALEEQTFTLVEGIAYLIIGDKKHCDDFDQRYEAVVNDYQNLLGFINSVEEEYGQQKNQLHEFFHQPPQQETLKEKTIREVGQKVQIFSAAFGQEEVDKIWDSIRLQAMTRPE